MNRALKKIMLVEDDPDIRLVTRLSLEVGGDYDVRACDSGIEALHSAAAYAPDLILLDMMMPAMDGLATMEALRKLPGIAATPIVFFTANTQDDVRQNVLRRGALGVIIKPVEPDALVAQVRALWQRFAPDSGSS
ncbi:MAG: response regulator [Burkholderiales bacterium]|nr:response regulator [Burkholderiales bacterium]